MCINRTICIIYVYIYYNLGLHRFRTIRRSSMIFPSRLLLHRGFFCNGLAGLQTSKGLRPARRV